MPDALTFIRGEPLPVVTIGDVAVRTGQKPDTVKHWIHRRRDTPEPIGQSVAGALYWWPDWQEWLRLHRPAVFKAMGNGQTLDSGGES
jgi:hypothetical protein